MSTEKIKVLIVEDVTTMQHVTSGILESLNCEVTVAENGQQALEYFSKERFNMIFMDLGLPLVDGLTVAESIRSVESQQKGDKLSEEKRVPIIALTAHSDLEYQSNRAGLDAFVTKPITTEKAKALINQFCLQIQI